MRKILHKIKHHISKRVHRKSSVKINFNFLFVSLFIFAFICTSLVSIFFITRGTNPKTSELAFIENSILGVSAGSVIPASCESYPSSGTAHFVGDTSGYCAGTAPVDGVCAATHYSCTSGRGVVSPTEDSAGWYWWCGGTNVNGYWGADAWCSEAKPAPPTPPTVEIHFGFMDTVKVFFNKISPEKASASTLP